VRGRDAARIRAQVAFFASAVFVYIAVDAPLRRWGIPLLLRWPLFAAIGATWMLPFSLLLAATHSDRYTDARLRRPALLATACTVSAGAAALTVRHALERAVPPLGSMAGISAILALVWIGVFIYARASRSVPLHRHVSVDHPDEAEELVAVCRLRLLDGSLSADERTSAELNLARALVTLFRADRDDGMLEACAMLEHAVGANPPASGFQAAEQLVEAMTLKAQRSGDLNGYEDALQLLEDASAAAAAVRPNAPVEALSARARSLERLSAAASSEGRDKRADALHVRAVAAGRRAVALAPRHSRLRAECTITLARILGPDLVAGDLDAAIKSCRSALRRLRPYGWHGRAEGYLALVDLLTLRAILEPVGGLGGLMDSLWPGRPRDGWIARLWPERATNDLARAMWICLRLGHHEELALDVAVRAPELVRRLRAAQRMGPGTRPVGRLFEVMTARVAVVSPGAAADLAEKWAGWATAGGDEQRAAEAHWFWIRSIVTEARRRVFLDDKERQVSRIQTRVTDASLWLLRAGRSRDAAVALELGRAVLLTERMHRERPRLRRRLIVAGRRDLADRWEQACERMATADRIGFDATADRRPIGAPDAQARTGPPGLASAEYRALAAHEQLLREVSRVPGCHDIDAPVSYEDLRQAAGDGAIVYLFATDQGGFALIVTDAPQPTVVRLPLLAVAEVEERARRLGQLEDPLDLSDEIAKQMRWLWRVAMQAVTQHLETGSLVTLIPVGALGLLPLHAAVMELGPDGVWRDQTAGFKFRYAPNARVLLRAQETMRAVAAAQPRALTVAVSDAPGQTRLPRAATESEGVAALFAPRVDRPSPACAPQVLASLDRCTIWHFACHGLHDPEEPLESHLLLADGPLSLRAMFARQPSMSRIAVLSACRIAIPDSGCLDEVVSFPSALLQAGVAGVVAAQAVLSDEATMLLVLSFLTRLSRGTPPAWAFAAAQDWLRQATNLEIHEALPDAYPLPAHYSADEIDAWRRARWFNEPYAWAPLSYSGA
jgi:CHAT domain-containing protein